MTQVKEGGNLKGLTSYKSNMNQQSPAMLKKEEAIMLTGALEPRSLGFNCSIYFTLFRHHLEFLPSSGYPSSKKTMNSEKGYKNGES